MSIAEEAKDMYPSALCYNYIQVYVASIPNDTNYFKSFTLIF